jgi:predicted O-methyltransferase YrrM
MHFRRCVPRFISARLSLATKMALTRRVEDLPSGLNFLLSPGRRRRAARDLSGCHDIQDLFRFARDWLGVGPVQILEEISGLITYLRSQKPRTVCEIGTESGGTSLLLSRGLPELEVLVCVDLFVKNMPRLRRFCPRGQTLRFVNGQSAAPRTIRKVTRTLSGRLLDVLFIDGDHRYAGACGDFLAYRHLVRPGGAIILHDVVPDHATRYGTATGRWTGDVPQLWERLKSLYPSRDFVADPAQDGFGLGVIQYDPKIDPAGALCAPACGAAVR